MTAICFPTVPQQSSIMRQTQAVLKTLKAHLKLKGIRYADVARHLGLSEASVKRLFADASFSMERLEHLCEMVDLDLMTLFDLHRKQEKQLASLSWEQEEEIAADINLLMVAVSVMNGMDFKRLVDQYELSETECIQKLARLDKLKFLELLPGNKIRLLISPDFRWQKDGPIQQFFLKQVVQEFFHSRFQKSNEKLLVLNAILSTSANHRLQEKMDDFARDFSELSESEGAVPMDERKGNTMVVALRQWQFKPFVERNKHNKEHIENKGAI